MTERIKLHEITHIRDNFTYAETLVGWDDSGEAWEYCLEAGECESWVGWRPVTSDLDFPVKPSEVPQ